MAAKTLFIWEEMQAGWLACFWVLCYSMTKQGISPVNDCQTEEWQLRPSHVGVA